MPRKAKSFEAELIAHFMAAPPLVAQAQLRMLTHLVDKRLESLPPLVHKPRPVAKPISQVVTPIASAGVVPGQPPVVKKSHKAKKPAGYAAGVGPASQSGQGPGVGDPGLPPSTLGE